MTTTVNLAADTGLPGVIHGNDIEPPTALDLTDDFSRIFNLIRVIHMTVEHPRNPNEHALAELCWTIEDRCETYAADLRALADKERVAS